MYRIVDFKCQSDNLISESNENFLIVLKMTTPLLKYKTHFKIF